MTGDDNFAEHDRQVGESILHYRPPHDVACFSCVATRSDAPGKAAFFGATCGWLDKAPPYLICNACHSKWYLPHHKQQGLPNKQNQETLYHTWVQYGRYITLEDWAKAHGRFKR